MRKAVPTRSRRWKPRPVRGNERDLDRPVRDLRLSFHTLELLEDHGFQKLRDMVQYPRAYYKVFVVGVHNVQLDEIEAALLEYNLRLPDA